MDLMVFGVYWGEVGIFGARDPQHVCEGVPLVVLEGMAAF